MRISCFTLTWQLRRTLPSRSCRLRCPNSVGSTSPPPSSTTHLHVAQVPPPPQAEGRNICCMARVVSSELPAGATKGLLSSPFMTIFTGPDCTSFEDRKSTRLNSSHVKISYAVFCLKKKKKKQQRK